MRVIHKRPADTRCADPKEHMLSALREESSVFLVHVMFDDVGSSSLARSTKAGLLALKQASS